MNEHYEPLEVTARTTEEAIEKALSEIGIRRENAEIEILEEASGGLLGLIGSREAKVSVRARLQPAEFLKKYLEDMIEIMQKKGRVRVSEGEDKLEAFISGEDVGSLIGRRGRTLGDLQYIVNIVMRKQYQNLRKVVVVDVENYRAKREKTLIQLAKKMARKAVDEGYEQHLEPMNPQERRVIHLALQDYPGITTVSDGEEPYRKVIIKQG